MQCEGNTMKIIIINLIFIFALFSKIHAQAPDTLWTKTFGGAGWDESSSVEQTDDGGFIIAGTCGSNIAGGPGVWLIKTNAQGDTIWTQMYGGSRSYVQQTIDGGYIIVANIYSSDTGEYDILLIKTDVNGDTMWTQTYGGAESDMFWNLGHVIEQTSDSGYIILANIYYGYGESEIWLIKTNSFGDTIWTKTYVGLDSDYGYAVDQTNDGGYIILAQTVSWSSKNNYNIWLIKTNSLGDTLWTKTYDEPENECAYYVQQTTDGGYIIIGETTTNTYMDALIIKTDISGNTIWRKTHGGSEMDCGHSGFQTADGGYIIGGVTHSWGAGTRDFWVIKTNASGDTIWTQTYGGATIDCAHCISHTSDGGYIIVGHTDSFGNGEQDIWLVRIASDPSTSANKISNIVSKEFALHQNYPNPFNPKTTIEFSIPKTEYVTLKIYDVLGKEVVTLVDKQLTVGNYEYDWDASHFASGIYYYRIEAGSFTKSKKLILIK